MGRTSRLLLAVLLMVLVFPQQALVASTQTQAQLTRNDVNERGLRVSGDHVVWVAVGGSDGGTDSEVFIWTAAGGVRQLTTNDVDERSPDVGAGRVVWLQTDATSPEQTRWSTSKVIAWTESDGQREILAPQSACTPRSSGSNVAWMETGSWHDGGFDAAIKVWTATDGIKTVATQRVEGRSIRWVDVFVSGNRLAWTRPTNPSVSSPTDIYTCEIGGTPVQVSAVDASMTGGVGVSGDRVVWHGIGGADGGRDHEIFMWTPSAGTVQLTSNAGSDMSPLISGDRIAWAGQGGPESRNSWEIFTWTPAGKTRQITHDVVNDTLTGLNRDRLAWTGPGGEDKGTDTEVFTWSPAEGIRQVTRDDGNQTVAMVSTDRIAWLSPGGSDGGTDIEVFTTATAFEPSVSAAIGPASAKKGKSFTVYGYLTPQHVAGSRPVLIYRERKTGTKWKAYGSPVKARVADYEEYSRYSAKITLPSTGSWRLRAKHSCDTHAPAFAPGYKYVKVK